MEIKFEIDLPGYEFVDYRIGKCGETYLFNAPEGWCACPVSEAYTDRPVCIVRPIKLKYDWSKTADYVWLDLHGDRTLQKGEVIVVSGPWKGFEIVDCWVPHFGGPCPFDPEVSIVEVRYRSGYTEVGLAKDLTQWEYEKCNRNMGDIFACRFIRLIDNGVF